YGSSNEWFRETHVPSFSLLRACGTGICRSSTRTGRHSGIDTDFPTRRHGHLPGDNHIFACRHSLGDDHVVSLPLAKRDWPQVCGAVGLNHVNKWSLLADLRGLIWNQHRVFLRGQNESHIDKLARPKMMVGVGHRRAQINGAGAVLYGVVKKRKLPATRAILRIR